MADFRIIVHMHHFFEDHRSSCRLFITSKIKTIKNLKEHIANLFELHADFYLIANNLYLPSLEDIRVLREDDTVVAVPFNRMSSASAICSSKSEVFQNASVDKAPKRRRGTFDESESENFDFQERDVVKKKKKRKNIEPEVVSCTNTEFNNLESISNIQKKEKKTKKQKKHSFNELMVSPNVTKEQQTDIKTEGTVESFNASNSEESCEVFEREKKIKKKSNLEATSKSNSKLQSVPLNDSRQPFIIPRKNIKLMEISTIPKVVKSICIRDTPIGINYVNNIECVSTTNVSSDNIYKDADIVAIQTNSDRNIPGSIINSHVNDKNNMQPCAIKYYSNETKILKLPTQEMSNESENQHPSDENKVNKTIPLPESQESDKKNITSSFLPQSNNTTENNHINANKKVKIISVEILNPANNENLLKNKTIGPQLIPFSQSTSKLVSNTNQEGCPTSDMTSDSVLHDITESNPLDSEVACAAGFKEPCVSTRSESIASTVTEESGLDLSLLFETKPKRKRIRKRKPKTKKQENVFEAAVVYPKPVFTSAAPAIHIRFDNGNGIDQHENNANNNYHNQNNGNDNNHQNENNCNVNDQNGSMACVDTTGVIDVGLNYDKFCKEDILKRPIMKERLPEQGNVIAFKICRLSDSYTPEISDVIIAKVLSYCTTTNDVCIKILEGADEFSTPEGKFYMENCDGNEEKEQRGFSWRDVIEPRLLIP